MVTGWMQKRQRERSRIAPECFANWKDELLLLTEMQRLWMKPTWKGKQELSFGLVTFEVSIKYSNGALSRKLDIEVKY